MSHFSEHPYQTDDLNLRLSISFIAFLISRTVVATFGTEYVLQDPDTLWHIKTGAWILENWRVPFTDIYSHTVPGRPWIANDWLADVIFAVAYEVGHWRGVVELTALAVGGITATICFYLTRVLRFSVAIGLTALTALLISPHYLARPVIFSYLLLSVWTMLLLDKYDDKKSFSPLWFIVLMILWANVHGSFTFGLLLLYIFASYSCLLHVMRREFGLLRREVLFVLAVSSAALITPYGFYSVLITPRAFEMKFALQYLHEWRSPDFQEYRVHLVYLITLISLIVAFGLRLRGPRLPAFMLLTYLGLSYLRGLVMFIVLMPFIFARPAARSVPYLRVQPVGPSEHSDPVLAFVQRHSRAVPAVSVLIAVVVSAAGLSVTDARPPAAITPHAALDHVRASGICGNVFNSYSFGGFLIFSGIPTFIDGRAQPFGDGFMRRYFNAIDGANIRELLSNARRI